MNRLPCGSSYSDLGGRSINHTIRHLAYRAYQLKRASPIWRSQIQTEGLSNQKGLRHKPPISKAILMKQITIVLRSESCCLIRYTPTGLEMVSTGLSTITSRLRVIGPSLSVLSTSETLKTSPNPLVKGFREAFRDAPRAAFTLHAGDLVDNNDWDSEWDWHQGPDWVNGTVPQ